MIYILLGFLGVAIYVVIMNSSTYTLELMLVALLVACILILVGTVLRQVVKPLRSMHLPSSVIGGVVGLIIGPQLLGSYWIDYFNIHESVEDMYELWKKLPGYLINIIFAALMLGHKLPSIKNIVSSSSAHLVVGYSIAWGQYVVGILVTLLFLMPFLDANPLSSALIAIGFQGGYGTAAGLSNTYNKLGFADGYDLALGMATAGKVSAILVGLALINIAVRCEKMRSPDDARKKHLREKIKEHEGKKAVRKQRAELHFSADKLVLHTAMLCVAIIIGWALRHTLFFIEEFFVTKEDGVIQYIPLFPMALLGGIMLQACFTASKKEHLINPRHIHSISHSFLDVLIVVAIATLSLKTLSANWVLLLAMIAAGIGWNLLVFFFIAPRFYSNAPWVRGLGDFAHSTGATTTGLLLMKVIDPNDETGARSSFNMKQPFYEPIVGGGFITAMALPLLHTIGLSATLALMSFLFIVTLIIGWRTIGFKKRNPLFRDV